MACVRQKIDFHKCRVIAEEKDAGTVYETFDDLPVVDISSVVSLSEQKLKSTEWAEMIDVSSSVDNFQQLIPNPAHTWPFELDNFQKHVSRCDLRSRYTGGRFSIGFEFLVLLETIEFDIHIDTARQFIRFY